MQKANIPAKNKHPLYWWGLAIPVLAIVFALLLSVFGSGQILDGKHLKFHAINSVSIKQTVSADADENTVFLESGEHVLRLLEPTSKAILIAGSESRFYDLSKDNLGVGYVSHTPFGIIVGATKKDDAEFVLAVSRGTRIALIELSEYQERMLSSRSGLVAGLFFGALALLTLTCLLFGWQLRNAKFAVLGLWAASGFSVGGLVDGLYLASSNQSFQQSYELAFLAFSCVCLGICSCVLLHLSVDQKKQSKIVGTPVSWVLAVLFVIGLMLPLWDSAFKWGAGWLLGGLASLFQSVVMLNQARLRRSSMAYFGGLAWAIQGVGLIATMPYWASIGIFSNQPVLSVALLVSAGLQVTIFCLKIRAGVFRQLDANKIALQDHKLLNHLLENVPAGLASFSENNEELKVNEKARQLLGLEPGQAINLHDLLLNAQSIGSRIPQENAARLEFTTSRKTDSGVLHLHLHLLRTDATTELVISDQTEQYVLRKNLRRLSLVDPLTQTGNRAALYENLTLILSKTKVAREAAVLMIDIERFRFVNSYFGQTLADQLLTELAIRLQTCVELEAGVFRLSGDRFVVLLNTCTTGFAQDLMQTVLLTLNAPYSCGDSSIDLRVTVVGQFLEGFSDCDLAMGRLAFLIETARAKKISSYFLDPNLNKGTQWDEEQSFVQELRSGTWDRNLVIYAQPLVRLAQADVGMKFEVLLRVQQTGRVSAPVSFLGAAESVGMMPKVDLWVLAKALEWLSSPQCPATTLTVNISGASLADLEFTEKLRFMLMEYFSVCHRLCIEVTENVAISNFEMASAFFNDLRAHGVKIALDDFGNGYTNFKYLAELPVDLLKLDGSLIKGLVTNTRQQAVVKSLREVGHALDLEVIAEWVEDQATADTLKLLGVDYAQGWLYAKAEPLDFWTPENFPRYSPQALVVNKTAVIKTAKAKELIAT